MQFLILSVLSLNTSLKRRLQTFVFLILTVTTVKSETECLNGSVSKGEEITLPSDLADQIHPPPNYAKWNLVKDNKDFLLALGERETGSPWKWSVAGVDYQIKDLNNNGDLKIKITDERFEGKYTLSYQNITLACYTVEISPSVAQVDYFKVVKYEEASIPNGVKRQWDNVFNMSTGNAIDCNMTIYLCRINSTKPDANIARCEVSEIVRYLHVDSCHFSVEWNETMNKTNSGTQMYLQFPMSDVFSRPKLFLLPTKVISTDPPEGSSRNHSSATTTTATSESNSKTKMTSPISTSPTITKQAICPSTTRPDYSETVPPVTGSEPPEVSTKEFVITNTSVCPTSACSWKSLIIAGISGAVVLAVVVISIFMYRRYYFRVPQVVHYEPTSCVELNENYFNAKEITHNVDHSSVSN